MSFALSYHAHTFYAKAATFSKNLTLSGEANDRLWQMESEGRAPHSKNNMR
jgi:phage tail sheath gpL-like